MWCFFIIIINTIFKITHFNSIVSHLNLYLRFLDTNLNVIILNVKGIYKDLFIDISQQNIVESGRQSFF